MAEPALTGASSKSTAFLDELEDKATGAASAVGGFEDFDFEVAGFTVRLRCAGEPMRRLLVPALAHLNSAPAPAPDLTIRVWDSESTGTTMVPPRWDLENLHRNGVIRGLDDGLYAVYLRWAGSLSVVDATRGDAWFWTKAASDVPSLERAAPVRTILRLWTAHQGVPLVHGGAVGDGSGCVLLAGPSGAGKSSAALTFLASELGYLGDDVCLVTSGPSPRVHALYRSAKVDPRTLGRIPQLAPLVDGSPPDDGKAVVFVPIERVIRESELRGIAIPRITTTTGTLARPAPAPAALTALVPSTLLHFPGGDQAMLRRIGDLVRAVPSHFLDVGTEPRSTAEALASLLKGSR